MKKFKSPISNGGVPAYISDLLFMQDEAWHGILGPLSMFDSDVQGVAVSGCVATGSSTLAITAGYVYLNGELMYFPGTASIAAPAYIVPDTIVNTPRNFKDGTTNVVTVTKNAKAQTSSVAGQYIQITSNAVVNTYLLALQKKINPLLSEDNISSSSGNFEVNLTTVGCTASVTSAHYSFIKQGKIVQLIIDINVNVSAVGGGNNYYNYEIVTPARAKAVSSRVFLVGAGTNGLGGNSQIELSTNGSGNIVSSFDNSYTATVRPYTERVIVSYETAS